MPPTKPSAKAPSSHALLLTPEDIASLAGQSEFTVFRQTADADESTALADLFSELAILGNCKDETATIAALKRLSHEDRVYLDHSSWSDEYRPYGASPRGGRMLACACNAGQTISITFRHGKNAKLPSGMYFPGGMTPTPGICTAADRKAIWHSGGFRPESQGVAEPYLFGHDDMVAALASLVYGRGDYPSGLLLVSGLTKVGKSEVARGLLHHLLSGARYNRISGRGEDRPVHVLTIEDPIEQFLSDASTGAEAIGKCAAAGIWYTPRVLGKDCASIEQALRDALRQTPTAVYIGEVRNDADWPGIMKFAATGHLVVATTHAATLVESIAKLFAATGATSPAARGECASRVFAAINLRALPLDHSVEIKRGERPEELKPIQQAVVLPSVWIRSPASMARLVAEGLAALLPSRPQNNGHEFNLTTGRTHGIQLLWKTQRTNEAKQSWQYYVGGEQISSLPNEVFRAVLSQDLNGG